MLIERFEEIVAWKKAKELTLEVYKLFEYSKDFGFKDQIQRASISIMNNIAEGFERGTHKQFQYFLYLMIFPYLLVGALLYFIIKSKRKNKI